MNDIALLLIIIIQLAIDVIVAWKLFEIIDKTNELVEKTNKQKEGK